MARTTVPALATADFVTRVDDNFPPEWAGSDYRQPGGVYTSLLYALSSQLAFALTQLEYAYNAAYINTETAPELDLASQDFFGTGLPRITGESDAAFRARIIATLFQEKVTRAGITYAVQAIINAVSPTATFRIIEGWRGQDCGYLGDLTHNLGCFIDVDNAAYPGRVSDTAWFGAVEIYDPASLISINAVLSVIEATKVFGTQVGVRVIWAGVDQVPTVVSDNTWSNWNPDVDPLT